MIQRLSFPLLQVLQAPLHVNPLADVSASLSQTVEHINLKALGFNFNVPGIPVVVGPLSFMVAGPVTALQQAYGQLYGAILRQATMIAYLYIFWVLAVSIVVMIPLLLPMKSHPRACWPERTDWAGLLG